VGDGPEKNRLQAQYPDAHFLGSLHGDQLGAIYRTADCFIFPSKTDTFGLVMAEALAAGVPVACYPSSGAQEIFGGEACGIMSEDLQSAALKALHLSRDLCRDVGKRHSLESSAENFVSILRDVVADYAATGSRLATPS
jgi:glycosyltransferase involved in cell wall biosynthesis